MHLIPLLVGDHGIQIHVLHAAEDVGLHGGVDLLQLGDELFYLHPLGDRAAVGVSGEIGRAHV